MPCPVGHTSTTAIHEIGFEKKTIILVCDSLTSRLWTIGAGHVGSSTRFRNFSYLDVSNPRIHMGSARCRKIMADIGCRAIIGVHYLGRG